MRAIGTPNGDVATEQLLVGDGDGNAVEAGIQIVAHLNGCGIVGMPMNGVLAGTDMMELGGGAVWVGGCGGAGVWVRVRVRE